MFNKPYFLAQYESLVKSLKSSYIWIEVGQEYEHEDIGASYQASERVPFGNLTSAFGNMQRSTFDSFGSTSYPDLFTADANHATTITADANHATAITANANHATAINTDFASSQSTITVADGVVIVLPKEPKHVDKHALLFFQFPVDQLSQVTRDVLKNVKLMPASKQIEEIAEVLFSCMLPVVGFYPDTDHYKSAENAVFRVYSHLASLKMKVDANITFKVFF